MRERDPRRLLARRREVGARVRIVEPPSAESSLDGSVTSMQVADVTLPASELERIWTPEYLERLARTYWLFLTRVSLGLLRVLYTPESREVVFIRRPFRLLTFRAPLYDIRPNRGSVTWPIEFMGRVVENMVLTLAPAATVRVGDLMAQTVNWYSR